jgi:hypothetical protein
MLPSFPLCRIHLAEKRVAVVSELLAGKSQMNLERVKGSGSRNFLSYRYKEDHPAEGCRVILKGDVS